MRTVGLPHLSFASNSGEQPGSGAASHRTKDDTTVRFLISTVL